MKNLNLKLNFRYEVHNNVIYNIFDDFGALFSFSLMLQTTFAYVTTIYQNRDTHHMIQFFVLFHLAGVSCLTLDNIMNFWHDLGVQLQHSDQKMSENAN